MQLTNRGWMAREVCRMSKELHDHEVPGKAIDDDALVEAVDKVGPGNAHHEYRIEWAPTTDGGCELRFQKGPLDENAPNGVTNEALIAIVLDRLRGFQTSDYACRENALMITKLEEALHWSHHRTLARIRRGVEGLSFI